MAMAVESRVLPREFIFRRLHSLMGLWLTLFIIEHLFTNSQVALFFGGYGTWFVTSVNFLQSIPYLPLVEILLIGVPIAFHAIWGLHYLMSAKPNSFNSDGSKPVMKYARSRAYTWQRISSIILFLGIVLHVVQMRFLEYPFKSVRTQGFGYYLPLEVDPGLYAAAGKLGVALYDRAAIERERGNFKRLEHRLHLTQERLVELREENASRQKAKIYNPELDSATQTMQEYEAAKAHLKGLTSRKITTKEVMAVATSFGALELLSVRQTFQNPLMCILYTIFVIAAVFHAFNGLWTFLITWGVILSRKSQTKMSTFCVGLMFVVGSLGLLAIWSTFFFTLGA